MREDFSLYSCYTSESLSNGSFCLKEHFLEFLIFLPWWALMCSVTGREKSIVFWFRNILFSPFAFDCCIIFLFGEDVIRVNSVNLRPLVIHQRFLVSKKMLTANQYWVYPRGHPSSNCFGLSFTIQWIEDSRQEGVVCYFGPFSLQSQTLNFFRLVWWIPARKHIHFLSMLRIVYNIYTEKINTILIFCGELWLNK